MGGGGRGRCALRVVRHDGHCDARAGDGRGGRALRRLASGRRGRVRLVGRVAVYVRIVALRTQIQVHFARLLYSIIKAGRLFNSGRAHSFRSEDVHFQSERENANEPRNVLQMYLEICEPDFV